MLKYQIFVNFQQHVINYNKKQQNLSLIMSSRINLFQNIRKADEQLDDNQHNSEFHSLKRNHDGESRRRPDPPQQPQLLQEFLKAINIKQIMKWIIFILFLYGIYLQWKIFKMKTVKFNGIRTQNTFFQLQPTMDQFNFKHSQIMKRQVRKQLNNLFKYGQYDAHYFLTDDDQGCQHNKPTIVYHKVSNSGQNQAKRLRHLPLQITKSQSQLEYAVQDMIDTYRPNEFAKSKVVYDLKNQTIDTAYFFYALNQDPKNVDFLQAEYYRYEKLYNISQEKTQHPLCICIVGRNNFRNVPKLYQSIRRQNYSNYHIVHIDDNSDDFTKKFLQQQIAKDFYLNDRITIIKQNRKRNQLYNRNHAIVHHCGQNQIVLDFNADDWLIGNQVFKLVNALFHSGNMIDDKKIQLWSLYLGHLYYQPSCECVLPKGEGKIPDQQLTNHKYRTQGQWRTVNLRAFRKKVYMKINVKDFIDQNSDRGQYFNQAAQQFIHTAIIEMSGPKHSKFINEYPYYNSITKEKTFRKKSSLQYFYSLALAQSLTPYQQLESLQSSAKRVQNYILPYRAYMHKKIKTWEIKEKRNIMRIKLRAVIDKVMRNSKRK